jgi:ribosome-binding protein aMBF1 (putative translation factor)
MTQPSHHVQPVATTLATHGARPVLLVQATRLYSLTKHAGRPHHIQTHHLRQLHICHIRHILHFVKEVMNSSKLKRLKAAGWKVGTAKDFLGLQKQEAALVEVKLSLIDAVKKSRQKRRLSQVDLAERIGSSQSRVAKIEAGDPSVSLDLIARALIATGATQKEILTTFTARQPLAKYDIRRADERSVIRRLRR